MGQLILSWNLKMVSPKLLFSKSQVFCLSDKELANSEELMFTASPTHFNFIPSWLSSKGFTQMGAFAHFNHVVLEFQGHRKQANGSIAISSGWVLVTVDLSSWSPAGMQCLELHVMMVGSVTGLGQVDHTV